MLIPLLHDDDCMLGISTLLVDISNGVFTGPLKERLRARTLIPLDKPNGGVRPIGMGEVFYRLAVIYAMRACQLPYKQLFPSVQYGVGCPGGCERVIHQLRYLQQHSPQGHIICTTDIKNAFNTRRRLDIYNALLEQPSCKNLIPLFHWAYATPSLLCVYEGSDLHTTLTSSEGVVQGDPLASFAFALSMQSTYTACVAGTSVTALAIQDDLYLCGEAKEVMTALGKLEELTSAMSLTLSRQKCQVLPCTASAKGRARSQVEQQAKDAGIAVVDQVVALGCLLSSDRNAVQQWCSDAVEEMDQYFGLLSHPTMVPQVAYTLLRQCAQPRMSYLARVVPNDHLAPAAQAFDTAVVDSFARMHVIADTLVTPDVKQAIHLPLSMGGMGIPSLVSISPAAYTASLLTAAKDIQSLPVNTDNHSTAVAQQLQSAILALQQGGVEVLKECDVAKTEGLINIKSARKLQHQLTVLVHEQQHKTWTATSSPARQAAQLSAAAQHAYRWLVNPLTDARHLILPLQWKLAIRHRLFLQPANVLPARSCTHADSSEHPLADEPMHFHVCEKHKKSAGYVRHQHVVKALQRWLHHIGKDVQYEPTIFGVNSKCKPDLLVYDPQQQWMIDVTITEPSGKDHLKSRHSATVPGAAARQAEKNKAGKYEPEIKKLSGVNHLTQFVPFVLETHGAIGKRALAWLQSLVADLPLPASELSTILGYISTALQVGNSELTITGLNSLASKAGVRSPIDLTLSDHTSEAYLGHANGRAMVDFSSSRHAGGHTLRAATMGRRTNEEVDGSGSDDNQMSPMHHPAQANPNSNAGQDDMVAVPVLVSTVTPAVDEFPPVSAAAAAPAKRTRRQADKESAWEKVEGLKSRLRSNTRAAV
jgi:hypothetical protein